jgi:hypothetical protein
MSLISAILSIFRKIISPDAEKKISHAMDLIAPYMPIVWDAVRIAAELTPNKTDDEIIALSQRFGVPELWGDRSREEVIRAMVAAFIKEAAPEIPDSVLNHAIELAYNAIKRG